MADSAAWGGSLIGIVLVVLLGLSLASLARNQETRLLPRWAWVVVCILAFPVGCVAYLLLGQPPRT